MLVLSRKLGQRIVIEDDVTVEILEIRGNQVRLGFSAPPTKSVHREEVSRRIARTKEVAIPHGRSTRHAS